MSGEDVNETIQGGDRRPAMRRRLRRGPGSLLLLLALALGIALPASAAPPTRVPFQGRLLDAGGTPLNGSVDLDFELFDALVNGTSLWSESHLGVIVVDGVYSVDLGATTPLTRSVLEGGAAFLEISVDGETLVPRQQLLSVPYALVSEDAGSLGGVSGVFFEQLIAGFPFDGAPPANDDPSEGTVDVDGDGTPNFLDPDNDGDGFDDADELASGSDINLITPGIQSVSPDPVRSWFPSTLVVTGTNLGTVSSVAFGAESPAPTQVTPTSFEIDVVTEANDASVDLTVTLGNGETNVLPVATQAVAPTITASTGFVEVGQTSPVEIQGTGFYPGTVVQIGTQLLVPTALTETSISVTMGPEAQGEYPLDVIHPNTLVASSTIFVTPLAGARSVFVSSNVFGDFGGLAAGDAACQAEADAAGLPGTYQAWLSDGVDSPSTRFDQGEGPYILPNGELVAADWADLTDGTIGNPIDVTAAGVQLFAAAVWTGTNPDGTPAPGPPPSNLDCEGWTSSAATGVYGAMNQTGSTWTYASTQACTSAARLYCFQD